MLKSQVQQVNKKLNNINNGSTINEFVQNVAISARSSDPLSRRDLQVIDQS